MASSLKIAVASAVFAFAMLLGVFSFHDSPVDAGSGSIYSSVRWFHYFHQHSGTVIYRTKPDMSDLITTTGLQNPPPLLTDTGGWTITFLGGDPSKPPAQDVFEMCSNANCDPSKGLDPEGQIYLKILKTNTKWITKSLSRKLYYHDSNTGCETSPPGGTEGPCDHLIAISIETLKKGSYPNIACAGSTMCKVTIGGADARKKLNLKKGP